ncbi:MAG: zinc-ribbon domain-containing protein [Solirubrobacteraceae bacterium]
MSTQSCAQCGAPLADDQRYCLHCGEPRPDVKGPLSGGPLADTRPHTPATPPGVPSSPPGTAPPSATGVPGGGSMSRNNSVALIAGVGVLLLAMGIGVLIGRAGSGSAKAAAPQVITVGGGGRITGSGATGTTGPQSTTTPEPTKETKKKEEQESKAPSGTGNSLSKPAPPSTLKALRKGGSGQSFEQRSKNLPNVVGT